MIAQGRLVHSKFRLLMRNYGSCSSALPMDGVTNNPHAGMPATGQVACDKHKVTATEFTWPERQTTPLWFASYTIPVKVPGIRASRHSVPNANENDVLSDSNRLSEVGSNPTRASNFLHLERTNRCKGRIDRACAAGLYHLSMGTPIRLLIADDSTIIRRAICTLLQSQTNIAVCGEAGNYSELLKIFNATTTDVVLMDVRMPGEKLFTPATIKAHFHGSCLLAMSVWNDAETASLARSYGAVKLLDKGNLSSTLVSAIEECAGHNDKDN